MKYNNDFDSNQQRDHLIHNHIDLADLPINQKDNDDNNDQMLQKEEVFLSGYNYYHDNDDDTQGNGQPILQKQRFVSGYTNDYWNSMKNDDKNKVISMSQPNTMINNYEGKVSKLIPSMPKEKPMDPDELVSQEEPLFNNSSNFFW